VAAHVGGDGAHIEIAIRHAYVGEVDDMTGWVIDKGEDVIQCHGPIGVPIDIDGLLGQVKRIGLGSHAGDHGEHQDHEN
jgi:hypothetical protein